MSTKLKTLNLKCKLQFDWVCDGYGIVLYCSEGERGHGDWSSKDNLSWGPLQCAGSQAGMLKGWVDRRDNTCLSSNTPPHIQKRREDGLSRRNMKNNALEYGNRVRKSKAHLELKVASDLKSNKKSFYMYIGSEWAATEHVDPLFSGTGDLLTKDME